MTIDGVIDQVNGVFRNVLDNDSIVLGYLTTANGVEGWRSSPFLCVKVGLS